VAGTGIEQFVRAPINFTPSAGTRYWIGFYCSDSTAVFPRKDTATYPFTASNVTVYAHQSTAGDVAPTSVNSWAPFIRVVEGGGGLSLSPSTVSFGNQQTGTVSNPTTITLTNTSTGVISVSSNTIAGPFQVAGLSPIALAPAAMTTFTVTFAPTAMGATSGSLKINSDDPASPAVLTLSGNGVGPVIGLSPTSLSYATQRVGTQSARQFVTISNSGTSSLTVASVVLGGANGADFKLALPTLPATFAPLESLVFGVSFAPTAIGARSATATVQSNDLANPSAGVALSGTGGAPAVTFAPTGLDFGNVHVAMSKSLSVVITNTGSDSVTINALKMAGPASFALLSPPTLPAILAPAASLTLNVSYSPTVVAMESGTLTVATDLTATPNLTVPLAGAGFSDVVGDVEEPATKDAGGPSVPDASSTTPDGAVIVGGVVVVGDAAEIADGGPSDEAGFPPEDIITNHGGCGCRMIRNGSRSLVGVLGVGLAVLFAAGRRRRRRTGP
jgi:MYXO-CTERM domain-containing protein